MCEILIHHYAFEPAIFHVYVLYSNLLSAQTLGMCEKRTVGGKYIYNIKRSALGCLSGSVFLNANACMYNLWVERLSSLKRWPTHKYVVQVLSTDKFWLSLAMRATNTASVTGLEGWVGGGGWEERCGGNDKRVCSGEESTAKQKS